MHLCIYLFVVTKIKKAYWDPAPISSGGLMKSGSIVLLLKGPT